MLPDFFSGLKDCLTTFQGLTLFRDMVSIFLTGVVIKITDDFIDQRADAGENYRSPWLHKLGKGALPYSILLFSLALAMNFSLSLSLYLSAYLVGMFKETDSIFPTGLKGYQEIGVVLVTGILITGWKSFFCSLMLMSLVQLVDDLIDFRRDNALGTNNIFSLIGRVEGSILLTIAVLINAFIQPIHALLTMISMLLICKTSIGELKWEGE